MIRSGGGEGVKGTGIAVDAGIVTVGVNVDEAGINVAVGVVTEGLHAHTLSSRIVETSSLDLLIRHTFISIPLTLRFEAYSGQLVNLDGSIPSVFPAPPVCRHSHSRRRVPRRRDSHPHRDIRSRVQAPVP